MAFEQFSVESIKSGVLYGRPGQASHCQQCSVRAGCGLKLLHQGKRALGIPALAHVRPGDTVTVAIRDKHLLQLSFLFYLLPLACMMAALLLADSAGLGESPVILSTLAGLVIGLLLVRRKSNRLIAEGGQLLTILPAGDD